VALEALMVLNQEGSSMKKLVILFAVLSLAVFILLPANSNGKYNVSKPFVADGSPLPWPPFPPGAGTLVADGSPLPWPPFPPGGGTTLA
jgi:hypothetical protein